MDADTNSVQMAIRTIQCHNLSIEKISWNIDRYSSINAPNESKLSHKYFVNLTSLTIILTL